MMKEYQLQIKIIDYLKNFDDYMKSENFNHLELIDNHVRIWYY